MSCNDAVHVDRVGENWILHYSDKHLWYYYNGMEVDELLVFRNTDSKGQRSRWFPLTCSYRRRC